MPPFLPVQIGFGVDDLAGMPPKILSSGLFDYFYGQG
jgi:hypothetical protein